MSNQLEEAEDHRLCRPDLFRRHIAVMQSKQAESMVNSHLLSTSLLYVKRHHNLSNSHKPKLCQSSLLGTAMHDSRRLDSARSAEE